MINIYLKFVYGDSSYSWRDMVNLDHNHQPKGVGEKSHLTTTVSRYHLLSMAMAANSFSKLNYTDLCANN